MLARDPDSVKPAESGATPGRPAVVVAIVLALALAPVLQAASLAGLRLLNFAPDRPWNYVAYGLAAPYVAVLLWRRHARARFAAYVFLTHEVAGVMYRDTVAPALMPDGRVILPGFAPKA